MQEVKSEFDKLFMEAVDDSLSVLPMSGREMLFFHLERSSSIRKHDIPKKPQIFIIALEQIFGAGAWVLEKLILKNLYFKLGLEFRERKNYTFTDYLKDVAVALSDKHTKRGEAAGDSEEIGTSHWGSSPAPDTLKSSSDHV